MSDAIRLPTAADKALFIHEAYGPRIDADTEFMAAVVLDRTGAVLRSVVLGEGARNAVAWRLSNLADALRQGHDGRYAFLAHNHPSGAAQPSESDYDMTHDLLATMRQRLSDYLLVDHIIVTPDPERFTSLRATTDLWAFDRKVRIAKRLPLEADAITAEG